jgi:hypothetical protein
MPNEGCGSPAAIVGPVGGETGCAERCRDTGAGSTIVTAYGTAERVIRMPSLETGMQGLARHYHGTMTFNLGYTAWDGSGTPLVGGSLPTPEVAASNLAEGAASLQPRPGSMPGIYLLSVEGEEVATY